MAGFDPDVFGTPAAPPAGFDPSIFSAPSEPAKMPLAPKKGSGSDIVDAGNAVGTGYFRALTRLVGLPVDTVANVIDLGKAGIGSAYSAVTGKAPPQALELAPRGDVVGSGDWLLRQATKTAPGSLMVNPANPDYEGGYLQAAGGGLTGVMAPASRLQAGNQALLGVTSNLSGKATMDATGNPALAVAASMAPSGIQQVVTAGTKAAVLGANPLNDKAVKARQAEVAQRTQDLKNAGISNPTLGLATGNRIIGGVENVLQSTPGAVGVMGRARDQAIAGLQSKADEAANLASTNRGSLAAGQAIQGGIHQFRDSFKEGQRLVYDKLGQQIGPQTPTSVVNTRERLGQLNADIAGAPALSRFFKNEKILALEGALNSDTSGSPQSVHVYRQPPRAGGGIMNAPVPQDPLQVVIPEGPPRSTLPFEAVKKVRTLVGDELADHSLMSTVPQSKWRSLYAGLTEDIGTTARETGPAAEQAFNRANVYTRAGMGRLEKLSPFLQAHHADLPPEQAFTTLQNTARENVSILQAVKKSLPEGARGQIAGTVIDRLGRATNANQNEAGTVWSPESFLTNWNKMTPKAREEMFSGFPNSKQVKADVDAVAKATSMMRDSSKMWANPSGTGANTFARGALAAMGIGGGASALGLLNPMVPLGMGTGMLGAYGLGSALTSQATREALLRPNTVSPGLLRAQTIPLLTSGLLSDQ